MIFPLRNVPLWALFLAAVIYPVNFSLSGLRPIDFLFIATFFLSLPFISVKISNLVSSLIFILILIASIFAGALQEGNFPTERLIFLYKYFFIFGVTLLLFNVTLSAGSLKKLLHLMFLGHLLLSLWVLFYIFAVSTGLIHGALRVSFPFSNDYVTSDAHLFSTVLGIGSLFFTFMFREVSRSKIVFTLFVVLSIGALLLTGSRTGIFIYILGIGIYALFAGGRGLIIGLVSLLLCVVAALVLPSMIGSAPEQVIALADRVISTDVTSDSSFAGRIVKMKVGIADAEYSLYLLGIGVLHSSYIWYDSSVGVLLSHVGLLGLIFSLVLVFRFWVGTISLAKGFRRNSVVFTIIVFCYVVANAVTEYFLISRSVFPFLIYCFILREYFKLEATQERATRRA